MEDGNLLATFKLLYNCWMGLKYKSLYVQVQPALTSSIRIYLS